jgi:hypothetical protein
VSIGRLESFSDGVIAVAITLLVLNLRVPDAHLGHELAHEWPTYAAYVTSFITIGIIWINHHVMTGRLARADHTILMLNLVLLLTRQNGNLPVTPGTRAVTVRQGALIRRIGTGSFCQGLADACISTWHTSRFACPRFSPRAITSQPGTRC